MLEKNPCFLPNFWSTKSEIIVPIIDDEHNRVVGVIIVESGKLNAFDKSDRDFLEGVAPGDLAHVSVTELRRLLESLLAGDRAYIGQISIERSDRDFVLCHRDDLGRRDLHDYPAGERARDRRV